MHGDLSSVDPAAAQETAGTAQADADDVLYILLMPLCRYLCICICIFF